MLALLFSLVPGVGRNEKFSILDNTNIEKSNVIIKGTNVSLIRGQDPIKQGLFAGKKKPCTCRAWLKKNSS
jgi:hypothetical protein